MNIYAFAYCTYTEYVAPKQPTDTQQKAKEYNEMLGKAIEEMKACKSYDEICAVWKKYQTFTKVDDFVKTTVEMQTKYPNPNAKK